MNRRKFIGATGSIVGLSTGLSTGAVARQADHKLPPEFKSSIIDSYGKKEGKRIISVVKGPYKRLKKGKLEENEFRNVITDTILKDKNLDGIQRDIIDLWSQKPPHHQIEEETWAIKENIVKDDKGSGISVMSNDEYSEWFLPSDPRYQPKTAANTISTSEINTAATSYPRWERFVFSETDKQNSGVSRSGSVVDPLRWCDSSIPQCYENEAVLRTKARSLVYGSAWSHARGYVTFSPSEDGDYTITAQYLVDGNSDTGATKLSIFARRHSDDAINPKIIDEPVTVDNEERSRYKQFNLDADESYDIGVELYSVTNASGSANSSDYYSSDDANGYRAARIRKHDDSSRSIKINKE